MSKAILLSIKPKYVVDILNGKKTIEIRKTMPKCDLPIDVYIYCTKGKPRAILTDKGCVLANKLAVGGNSIYKSGYSLDGQVVAKFTLRKVEEITNQHWFHGRTFYTKTFGAYKLIQKSCLSDKELSTYLKGKNGYAYHIEDLVIFDKPKELSEFKRKYYLQYAGMSKNTIHYELEPMTKAPQSYCFVESED